MQVFGQNADRTRGGAFQELRILVGNFGCVLGLELAVPWGHEISPKERASILGIAERDGNVWGRSCVELDTLDTEARYEETAILGHIARGSSGRAPSFRTFGAGFRASAYRAD